MDRVGACDGWKIGCHIRQPDIDTTRAHLMVIQKLSAGMHGSPIRIGLHDGHGQFQSTRGDGSRLGGMGDVSAQWSGVVLAGQPSQCQRGCRRHGDEYKEKRDTTPVMDRSMWNHVA